MEKRSKVELFEQIRRDRRVDDLSSRELAAKYRVHRRTVGQALESALPPPRKQREYPRPVADRWEPVVREWLEDDRSVPRKQRHTARRVWERLVEEHDAQIGGSTVRELVARIRRDLGQSTAKVMIPQTHLPGAEAEVDFGEAWAYLAGELVKVHLFVMRLSYSAKAVHFAYVSPTLEAFLDGHVRAFAEFGGVPGRIRYDNLKAAVTKMLLGRERVENHRFIAMRSHYGFDTFFCLPGVEGAHEKGGVEGEIGRFRRRHMTPLPVVGDLAALNTAIAAGDRRDDARHVDQRRETIAQWFTREAPALQQLPDTRFDPVTVLSVRVDTKARVSVRGSHYSVPARLVGRRVEAALGGMGVQVRADGQVVATHGRALRSGSEVLDLDHYLEVLLRKPGALAGATALVQAKAMGAFTQLHQRFWDAATTSGGDSRGTKALIGVLLLHRTMPYAAVTAGMAAALAVGSTDPNVVAVEARRHQDGQRHVPVLAPTGTDGIPSIAWARPTPSLSAYDNLLQKENKQ